MYLQNGLWASTYMYSLCLSGSHSRLSPTRTPDVQSNSDTLYRCPCKPPPPRTNAAYTPQARALSRSAEAAPSHPRAKKNRRATSLTSSS